MSLPGGSATVTMKMSVQAAQSIIEKDFDLLQVVLDLMQSVENPKDQKEELTRKVATFKSKMTQCKDILSKLPGLEYSPEEQDVMYEKAVIELDKKRSALERLKQLKILSPLLQIKQEPH